MPDNYHCYQVYLTRIPRKRRGWNTSLWIWPILLKQQLIEMKPHTAIYVLCMCVDSMYLSRMWLYMVFDAHHHSDLLHTSSYVSLYLPNHRTFPSLYVRMSVSSSNSYIHKGVAFVCEREQIYHIISSIIHPAQSTIRWRLSAEEVAAAASSSSWWWWLQL